MVPSEQDLLNCRSKRGMRMMPLVVAALLVFGACGESERSYVANVGDGDVSPTMTTLDVETFISDSGYTRYHITTPTWMMYEDAKEPFWRFPDGLDMQQYDLLFNPDASMICDSAVYYSRLRLWRLDGHVMMVNTMQDTFLSQQLFWDQAKRNVYTDSFIHIVRSDRIIEGYGFNSNENMTAYTINRPTAIIPVERRQASVANDTILSDSTAVEPVDHRRRTARKLSTPRMPAANSQPERPVVVRKDLPSSEPMKIKPSTK